MCVYGDGDSDNGDCHHKSVVSQRRYELRLYSTNRRHACSNYNRSCCWLIERPAMSCGHWTLIDFHPAHGVAVPNAMDAKIINHRHRRASVDKAANWMRKHKKVSVVVVVVATVKSFFFSIGCCSSFLALPNSRICSCGNFSFSPVLICRRYVFAWMAKENKMIWMKTSCNRRTNLIQRKISAQITNMPKVHVHTHWSQRMRAVSSQCLHFLKNSLIWLPCTHTQTIADKTHHSEAAAKFSKVLKVQIWLVILVFWSESKFILDAPKKKDSLASHTQTLMRTLKKKPAAVEVEWRQLDLRSAVFSNGINEKHGTANLAERVRIRTKHLFATSKSSRSLLLRVLHRSTRAFHTEIRLWITVMLDDLNVVKHGLCNEHIRIEREYVAASGCNNISLDDLFK